MLKSNSFRISISKTEYMKYKFSASRNINQSVTLDGSAIPVDEYFRYLGSIIQKDGELDNNVAHRIKAGLLKWRSATSILYNRNIPLYLKEKFYRTDVRPALLYGTECWAIKGCHI
jgi:hypothetical protein